MTTLYRCLRGSFAQGTDTEKSDKDYFEIFLPPKESILGMYEVDGKQSIVDGIDTLTITLKKFLRQAVHGRSTELECLFANMEHVEHIHPIWGMSLLANKEKLVSRQLFKGLLGFYKNQKYRMFRGNCGRVDEKLQYDPKMGCHCLRAIWQAINLEKTDRLEIFVDDPDTRVIMRDIKAGKVGLGHLTEILNKYEAEYAKHENTASIPENPDADWANNFLIEVHKNHVIAS